MTGDAALTLDMSLLVDPTTPQDLADWRRDMATRPDDWSSNGTAGAYAAAVVTPLILGVIGWVACRGIADRPSSLDSPDTADDTSGTAILTVCLIAGAIVLALLLVTVWLRARRLRWMRIDRFARANGMTFAPGGGLPSYPGMIFDVGSSRNIGEHVRGRDGRFFDYGSYFYTTGSGKSRQTHDWGYLAFRLDRRLPHMVLDAKSNDHILSSNLPARFNRDQHLSLEGGFDRHFTLYCPSEYERDALYVFTPDLMALLIDEVSAFDVEVVDDWMFVYSTVRFSLDSPAVHERMHQIMQTVGAKTVRQTERYADERVPDARVANIVAPPGRRLRRTIPVSALIAFGFVAVVIVVNLSTFAR